MIVVLAAAQVLSPDQAAVQTYKDCLAPIATQNQPLDTMLTTAHQQCASKRRAARNALATHVAATIKAQEDRTLPENDMWKEKLIDDATIRWMNDVAADAATKDH